MVVTGTVVVVGTVNSVVEVTVGVGVSLPVGPVYGKREHRNIKELFRANTANIFTNLSFLA